MSKPIDAKDVRVGDRIRATHTYPNGDTTIRTFTVTGLPHAGPRGGYHSTTKSSDTFELLDRPAPELPAGTVALVPVHRTYAVRLENGNLRYLDTDTVLTYYNGKTFDQLVASGEWIVKYQPGVS